MKELLDHPRSGVSGEGFALEEVVRSLRASQEECFFWATHAGAELDLLVVRGKERLGFEFKRSTRPGMTPSMRSALKDLGLAKLWVIHAGEEGYPLGPRVEARPLGDWAEKFP